MTANTFSWESLEEFVGRGSTLQEIQEYFQRNDFRVVFFTGGFGIGKTRLIKQILIKAKERGTLATPSISRIKPFRRRLGSCPGAIFY